MKRYRVNVLGVSEVRWKEGGDFESDGYRVLYSGGNECQRGVAVILDKEAGRRVTQVERCSDRLMIVKLKAEPVDMILIQVYMPTSDHEDDEIEELYEEVEEILEKQRGTDNIVIMAVMLTRPGPTRPGGRGHYPRGRGQGRGQDPRGRGRGLDP